MNQIFTANIVMSKHRHITNVAQQHACIVDLGLAVRLDDQRAHHFGGTLPFISPEVFIQFFILFFRYL
jgi:hypothetical protein